MPRLPSQLAGVARRLTQRLIAGDTEVAAWEEALARALVEYHLASYADGAGIAPNQLTSQERRVIAKYVQLQLDYLQGFGNDLEAGRYAGKPLGAAARAAMYGGAANGSWWMGKTRGYVLPAYPGDGTTQCRTNCRCRWEIVPLEGSGNANAYWRLGAAEHCQTCAVRAEDWSPLEIRGGDVVLKEYRSGITLKAGPPTTETRRYARRHVTQKGWVTIHGRPVLIGDDSSGGEGGGGNGHAPIEASVAQRVLEGVHGDPNTHPELQAAQAELRAAMAKDFDGPEYATALAHVEATRAKVIAETESAGATALAPLLAKRQPATMKVEVHGEPPPEVKASIDHAADFVRRMTGPGSPLDKHSVAVHYHNENGAAWAEKDGSAIHIYRHTPPRAIVHELGHVVELRGDRAAEMQAFLAQRTAGQRPKKLKALLPKDGYGPDEVTIADSFFHPYVGKQYKEGGTEVLSMALEHMYSDPKALLAKDPEMFQVVWKAVVR